MSTKVNQQSRVQDFSMLSAKRKQYKIFVGGLPSDTSEEGLLYYFQQFGRIINCSTKKWNSDSQKCKGFALLTVDERSVYDRIIRGPHFWNGRAIECKKAIIDKETLIKHNQKIVSQKIFITGLPLSATDKDIHDYFKPFGPIEMAYVVKKTTKKYRIGYVCFKKASSKEAVLNTSNHKIKGNKIYLLEYQTKSNLEKNKKELNPHEDLLEHDQEFLVEDENYYISQKNLNNLPERGWHDYRLNRGKINARLENHQSNDLNSAMNTNSRSPIAVADTTMKKLSVTNISLNMTTNSKNRIPHFAPVYLQEMEGYQIEGGEHLLTKNKIVRWRFETHEAAGLEFAPAIGLP